MIKDISRDTIFFKLVSCLIIIITICILIATYSFKNGKPMCRNYILNTYLHTILSLLLIFMMVLVNDKYNIVGTLLMNFEKHNLLKIILIILFIGLIIGVSILISKVKPTNVLLSYGLWLLLIISFGIVLLLNNLSAKLSNNLTLIFISIIIIIITTALLGFYLGDDIVISSNWNTYLHYILWSIIGTLLISSFFIKNKSNIQTLYNIIYMIIIIIFILLLISNNKEIRDHSLLCNNEKITPSYTIESFGMFIKLINTFINLLRFS